MWVPVRQCPTEGTALNMRALIFLAGGRTGVASRQLGTGVGHWQCQDKWPLCATFGKVKEVKGIEGAVNKGCLHPPFFIPFFFSHGVNSLHTLAECHWKWKEAP